MKDEGYFDVSEHAEDEDGELVNASTADRGVGALDSDWLKETMRKLLEELICQVSQGADVAEIDLDDGGVWVGRDSWSRDGYWISQTEVDELMRRIDGRMAGRKY